MAHAPKANRRQKFKKRRPSLLSSIMIRCHAMSTSAFSLDFMPRLHETRAFEMAGCLFVNLMCMALPLLCLSGVSCQDCGPLDFDIANLKR